MVGLHGITANSLAFAPLAAAIDGLPPRERVDLVAPDLRGRAGSAGLPGPFGLERHTDDVIGLLDHLGQERAVLAGHSMGAFVAALTAVRHPDRVSAVLLIDGGISFGVVPDDNIDAVLEAVIGPAIQRLSMTFETPESYLDFWRAHPALAGRWSPAVEAHVMRDLHGTRSSCNVDAIRADGRDTLQGGQDFKELTCPTTLVYAERGMLDEPQALYDPARLTLAGADSLPAARIDDVNHYTIMLSTHGVTQVATHLTALVR